MELQRLIPHHRLQQILRWLEVVPRPVEGLFCLGLSLLVVKSLEVGVLQALLHGVAFLRVENEHLGKQIQSNRVRLRVQ